MKHAMVVAAIVVGAALPASAEHLTHVDPATGALKDPGGSSTLDVDVKLGTNAFRIGGRVFGENGVSGAWLNGQVRPDGVSLDGRVQGDTGRAHNFKIEIGLPDVIGRTALWLLRRPMAD